MIRKCINHSSKEVLTEIRGTRYHKVVLLSQDEIKLMCLVSTPLSQEEMKVFIENRIGNPYASYSKVNALVTESDLSGVDDRDYTKVMGLSTFEKLLTRFVPEIELKEETKTFKVTTTNLGVKVEEVIEKEKGDE